MSIEIKVPDMGESIVEATVIQWFKQPGEAVAAGEAVAELETDKVTLEVSAPQAGRLGEIRHVVGENVAVGDVLATLEESGAADPPQAKPTPAAATPAPAPAPAAASEAPVEAPPAAPAVNVAVRAESPQVRATPLAQRMAQDKGVDLAKVPPTGGAGRVTKEDVQGYLSQSASAPAVQPTTATPATKPAGPPHLQ